MNMKPSKKNSLNLRDFALGALYSVGGSILPILIKVFGTGKFPSPEQWKEYGAFTISFLLVYLLRNIKSGN